MPNKVSDRIKRRLRIALADHDDAEELTSMLDELVDSVMPFEGAGAAGLVPDPGSETNHFLRDDGLWSALTMFTGAGTTGVVSDPVTATGKVLYDSGAWGVLAQFTGPGTSGFVPNPVSTSGRFLTDDGSWTSVAVFGVSTDGLVPNPGAATGLFLKDDGTWGAAGTTIQGQLLMDSDSIDFARVGTSTTLMTGVGVANGATYTDASSDVMRYFEGLSTGQSYFQQKTTTSASNICSIEGHLHTVVDPAANPVYIRRFYQTDGITNAKSAMGMAQSSFALIQFPYTSSHDEFSMKRSQPDYGDRNFYFVTTIDATGVEAFDTGVSPDETTCYTFIALVVSTSSVRYWLFGGDGEQLATRTVTGLDPFTTGMKPASGELAGSGTASEHNTVSWGFGSLQGSNKS